MPGSSLEQYMQNYGQRLQSLLSGISAPPPVNVPQPTVGAPPSQLAGPTAPATPVAQQSAMQPPASGAAALPADAEGEGGFRSIFKAMPKPEQKQAVDDFEDKQLKQGNLSIDSAYDNLAQQIGHPPNEKLTREDKGMLLMEFGLNLMRASSGGRQFGAAVGDAGAATLSNFQTRRQQEKQDYTSKLAKVEQGRAEAKTDLAKQSALESSRDHRYEQRDIRREKREDDQVTRTVTDENGDVYGVTRGGETSLLEDQGGGSIRAPKKPGPAGARGGRGFESDARYQRYMEVNGKGPDGKPLTGAAMRAVQQEALEFSRSTRTGSNDKQWTDIFRDATRRGGSPEEARKEADSALGPRRKDKSKGVPSRLPIPNRKVPSQKAMQYLQAHPETASQFEEKYGFLPEGMQSQLQ